MKASSLNLPSPSQTNLRRSKSGTALSIACYRQWQGPGTHEIPLSLYSTNRNRLIDKIRSKTQDDVIAVLQGGDEIPFYDTNITYSVFKQESFFMWTFGVTEPGFYGALDITTRMSYLFMPRYLDDYKLWKGPLLSRSDFAKKYEVDNVHYVDEMASVFKNLNPTCLLTLRGINADSNLPSREAHFPGIEKFPLSYKILYNAMASLRVYKSDMEIDVLKYVNNVSSEAHCRVMRFAKPGKTEYQCEAEFLHYCYSVGGCRDVACTPMCASNGNAVYLNYGHAAAPNNKIIEPADLCVFNMGAKYFGYCANITCTFPASGKFTALQSFVYEAVLDTHLNILRKLKPGVSLIDMHLMAHRILLGNLKKKGLLKGDIEQMVHCGLGSVFQPHGVAEFLGLDVHDVGGNINAKHTDLKGAETLKTARVLEERMVITLQTGCYFNDYLFETALEDAVLSRFFSPEIKNFRQFGGVKIGDNVVITKTGATNLTHVPRTVKEIEDWIAGLDDDKYAR